MIVGTTAEVLDSLGLGPYPGTAMPGVEGNFAVAGHRQTDGAVQELLRIRAIEAGEQ